MKQRTTKQQKAPLLDALKEYKKLSPAYFCVPGHRGSRGIDAEFKELAKNGIFDLDLTETPLTDDLHAPEAAIKEAQDLAAELWGSDASRFLINGSSCGNIAMVMAAAREGEKICIARNAHRSAFTGLVLSGARPVYITPQTESRFGIHSGITPDQVREMFRKNPDCKGLLLVSPTYYGICSDLKRIAEICHENGALLMVDEAHGAHLHFSTALPEDAMDSGADICVQSTHKTCGALTQSSMLHIKSSLIDTDRVDAVLRMIQSSSPSYILMASLDAARRDLAAHGREYADKTIKLASAARKEINRIRGLKCLEDDLKGSSSIFDLDQTRLVVNVSGLGLSGLECKKLLFEKYNVDLELADDRNIVAVISFANTEDDIIKLTESLADIERQCTSPKHDTLSVPPLPGTVLSSGTVLTSREASGTVLTPREAFFAEKERIPWEKAEGRICAEMIAPYPPGIPAICPGETLTEDVWNYLDNVKKKKGHMHGPSDSSLETVLVIADA